MDQVTVKGVFSQEANEEAERLMKSMTNILSVNGTNIRLSSIEAVQCLYSMTMWENKNKKFDTRKSK